MTGWKNILQLAKFKILLIGDSCIDEYKIGTVDRLSPEAPVPVVKIVNEYTLPGMSANVKQNLINLGIEPDFVTNYQEIKKTRFIDYKSGQHLLRVDSEPMIDKWNTQTPSLLSSYDTIIISDYNKGFLSYEHIEKIIASVRVPIFIDTKKPDLSRFSADWVFVKINETEYKNRYSVPKNLIVTLGGKGALFKQVNVEFEYETAPVEVMDVCGCGDTFLSSLAVHYLFTKNIGEAIMYANVAAGITVQRRGNYAPTLEEIINARHRH